MPTRMNRPDRVNARRKIALENWEERAKQPVETLIITAKRFQNNANPSEKEIGAYRSFINSQIQILKGRVQ